jgi:hypothetical protein
VAQAVPVQVRPWAPNIFCGQRSYSKAKTFFPTKK